MKSLIFKESFDWDKRFMNDKIKKEHDDEIFCKGALCGVLVIVISGILLSIVNTL